MMVIYLALGLVVCAQSIVGDDVCRVRGNLTNSLKCGDKVYTRDQEVVEVMKACTVGKRGEPITMEIIRCLTSTYGVLDESGNSVTDKVLQDLRKDFGAHGDQLLGGIQTCFMQFKDEPSESTKLVSCMSAAYEKVCGYKTCNWLNNIV